jgi:hypothetical protein
MRAVECRRVEVKRDMDLIRDILLKVEADPELDGMKFKCFEPSDFDAHSQQEITYHIDLLFEAGFLQGSKSMDPIPAVSRLTWQGHEFIGSISDPGVWEQVKNRLKGLPTIALSVVFELGKAELKKKLNLP